MLKTTLLTSTVIALAITAQAGNLSPPVTDAVLAKTPVSFETGCVNYIRSIVWWDHGSNRFISELQNNYNLSHASARAHARQYCREKARGFPNAKERLLARLDTA